MNLIIETDLGHDPDDFFTILWLISVGVNIRCVTIVPGHPDQVAVAQLIKDVCGLDFLIGASKYDAYKMSSGGIHHEVLINYGIACPWDAQPDGDGLKVIEKTLEKYPDCELFVIGPCTSLGKYIKLHPNKEFTKGTFQGGFCPYELHYPNVQLDKFQGLKFCPTFNMNGDRPGALAFINAKIKERRFIGKNVCHAVLYNKEVHARLKPKDRASELFKEGMDLYLAKHEDKKFHDPTAAVAHLFPEVATWIRGKPTKIESGWGTVKDDNGDYVGVDLDQEVFWDHIVNFK